jgi:hypothetical protein
MDKEKMKKQMEGFKQKIYFELQNHTSEVLIFGNDNISTACGELPLIMFKLASLIMQLSQQSDLSEKKILKGIKEMIDLYKKESNYYE